MIFMLNHRHHCLEHLLLYKSAFFIHHSGMRMARMWNKRVLLISHSYSGMDRIFSWFHPFCSQGQNEQNVANEIQDGGQRDKRYRFKCAPTGPAREKIRIAFWIQWNIDSFFFVPKVRDVFSYFSFKKKAIWQLIAEDMKKKMVLTRAAPVS